MALKSVVQTSLLCGCGSSEFHRAGLCLRCERRQRLNREHFNGLRESVLRRDDWQCQVCGELDPDQIVVHHRPVLKRSVVGAQPLESLGVTGISRLITLCRCCHAKVHHTWRPTWGFLSLELLRRLWKEAHRGLAEQRLLALLAEEQRERQARLFDSLDG